ncbi:hypothetical protein [Sphingomonas abaci]|uniref:XRE family transcriptional regulator n=1 Tax=Sphingomonas abaci TaxID=237611 RepID=A0A7W7EZD4_9SPHN|nr:hypothetical protein [Sphingomonas abaci]MBB4619126.1 hypothetical protein [Sphingomonas abaci]
MSNFITPGQYLKFRRQAAGLTALGLALCIDTVPALCAHDRAALIEEIEADLVPTRLSTALVLAKIPALAIDLDTLARVVDAYEAARFCVEIRIMRAPTLAETRQA